MAKKSLINPDMLLATPRAVERPEPVAEQVTVAATPEVTPSVSPKELPVETVPDKPTSSVQKGLKAGETRATFIVREDDLDKIKAIAYWDRLNIKEVVQAAFELYVADYERKNGSIEPVP